MRGFTLIELLVVVAISMILAMVGIPSFNNYTRRQVLVQAAENFKSDLQRMQNRARSGIAQTSGDSSSSCWGLLVGTGGGGTPCPSDYCLASDLNCVSGDYSLEKQVDFSVSRVNATDGEVIFEKITGFPDTPAVFTLTFDTLSATVTVGAGGNIVVTGP